MKYYTAIPLLLLYLVSIFALTNAKCSTRAANTLFYDDLKCIPKYNSPTDTCPNEYDCSHIYNRPAGTCHLQGKFYKPGEAIDPSIRTERCDHALCTCGEGGIFSCRIPTDSCAEFWVPEFVKPGCYLTHEFKRCCSSGQKCPPFNNDVKCVANGVTYQEGQQFNHPTKACSKCICDKNYDEKIDGPSCRQRNCTTELLYSKQIQDNCAPYFRDSDTCCPSPWICPINSGIYLPASKPSRNQKLKCKFGTKTMKIGEKYEHEEKLRGKVSCECLVPPYLTCKSVRN